MANIPVMMAIRFVTITNSLVTLPLDLSSAQLLYSFVSFIMLLNFNTSILIMARHTHSLHVWYNAVGRALIYVKIISGLYIMSFLLVFVYGRSTWISTFAMSSSWVLLAKVLIAYYMSLRQSSASLSEPEDTTAGDIGDRARASICVVPIPAHTGRLGGCIGSGLLQGRRRRGGPRRL